VALEPQPRQHHGQLPNTERPSGPHAPSIPGASRIPDCRRLRIPHGLRGCRNPRDWIGRHTRNVGSSTACVWTPARPRLATPQVFPSPDSTDGPNFTARHLDRAGSLELLGGTRDARCRSQEDRFHDELRQT
jgi:hypothetical protein